MRLPFRRSKAPHEAKAKEGTRARRRLRQHKPEQDLPKDESGLRLESAEAFLRQPAVVATVERAQSGVAVHQLGRVVLDGHVSHGRRGLAVCGATAGSGIVGVASSLAASISMEDMTVLLVDAQPATPRADPSLVVRRGLADILVDESTRLQDVVFKGVLPGLDLLSPGSALSSDLLEGEKFSSFARDVLRLYDCTIVCAPPANRSPSALTIARNMGHAVIVARAAATFYDDLVQMTGELRKDGVNILGSVMIEA